MRRAREASPALSFFGRRFAAAYAVLVSRASFAQYLMNFFVPTLIGNTIGGSLLVALLNHAPVAAALENSEEQQA